MWNFQRGKTRWMSSVLEPHKVTSVLYNLVPMVTNPLSSRSNIKMMSKQVHCVMSANITRRKYSNLKTTLPKLSLEVQRLLRVTGQTVPADGGVMCVICTANLIHWDSRVSLLGLFAECLCECALCDSPLISTWSKPEWTSLLHLVQSGGKFVLEQTGLRFSDVVTVKDEAYKYITSCSFTREVVETKRAVLNHKMEFDQELYMNTNWL